MIRSVDYERRILIFDDPEGELQAVALELVRREFGVHYANDPDEAQLLAQDQHGQIGAVLLSSKIEFRDATEMARRFAVVPAALIPTGPKPANSEIAELAGQGVRWHLWGEPKDEIIRFVVGTVLSEQDAMDLRFDVRIPTNFNGELSIGSSKGEVAIRDLSLGGAWVLGGIVGNDGDAGSLCFSIGDVALDLGIEIAWSVVNSGEGAGVAGVSFRELDPESSRAINVLVDSVVDEHRVRVPAD